MVESANIYEDEDIDEEQCSDYPNEEVRTWSELVKKESDVNSMLKLSSYYSDRDINKAIHYLKQAADCGSTDAVVSLGRFAVSCETLPDRIGAMRRAAEMGEESCFCALGDYYVDIDKACALEWYLKATNDARGMFEAARLLLKGQDGVEKDVMKGMKLMLESARVSGSTSMAQMAFLAMVGDTEMDLSPDATTAFEFLYQSTEQSPETDIILGECLLHGHGCDKNASNALECFTRASSSTDSQVRMKARLGVVRCTAMLRRVAESRSKLVSILQELQIETNDEALDELIDVLCSMNPFKA